MGQSGLAPWMGFAVSIGWVYFYLICNGSYVAFIGNPFLPAFLYAFGFPAAAAWLRTPLGTMIVSVPIVALVGLLFVFGMGFFRKIILVLFAITVIGVMAWFGVMAFGSNLGFINSFNNAIGANAYENIIQAAKDSGMPTLAASGINSFYGMIYGLNMYGGYWSVAYAGGELKNAGRTAFVSMTSAIMAGFAGLTLGSYLIQNYYGKDFISALAYLSAVAPGKIPLPLGGWLPLLIIYMTQSPLIIGIILLSFVVTNLWVLVPEYLLLTRCIFAMAFDRVLPSKLADVNEHYHTPVKAAILVTVLTYLFVYLFEATTYFNYLTNLIELGAIITIIVGITAVVVPYRKKEWLAQAPSIVTAKFLGVPILAWAGIGSIIGEAVNLGVALLIPTVFGGLSVQSILACFASFPLAFVIYAISYYVHKSRGIDLSLVFKEIPPE